MTSNAFNIAKRDLRACYTKKGILAGIKHFDDYWARDSLFACLGALEIKDYDIVKKTLELFIEYQHKNGQIPLRVGDYFIVWKLMGLKSSQKIKARYDQDKLFSHPTDQNSLFVIIFSKYIDKTKDVEFLKKHFKAVKKAIEWNISYDKDNDYLMEEKYYATWADSLKKKGKVLYTNVLHCAALSSYSMLCKRLNKKQAIEYAKLADKVKQKINEHFWNGKYYIDWIDKSKQTYFSTDGNVLAIIFNIATKTQAKSIQKAIVKFGINNTVPSLTNHPKYKSSQVSIINKLVGIGDYHNGICWLWLGCLDVVAKNKVGLKKEAKELLAKISDVIVKHNGVYEVYEQNGFPINRWFYKSEKPFAWSAGLFIYACKKTKT